MESKWEDGRRKLQVSPRSHDGLLSAIEHVYVLL